MRGAWWTPLVMVSLLACGDGGGAAPDATADPARTADVPADVSADPRAGACPDHDPLRRVHWGDLHVHTALSLDANLQGTRLGPSDAYRFARGEALDIQPYDADGNGLRTIQLGRPLDFAAATDHAEFLGTVNACTTPGSAAYDHPECVTYRESPQTAFLTINFLLAAEQGYVEYPALCGEGGEDCVEGGKAAWAEVQEAAAAADDPCEFTSFVGYEWSGNPGAYNLHRNVIFANEAVPEWPTSYLEESWPQGLWASLREGCLEAGTGCDVLLIPHNSNLSGGLMFDGLDQAGEPMDAAYAAEQAAMEPLVEVFQHKGDSECAPGSPLGDELCGFEKMPYDNLAGANLDLESDPQPRDFVRDALGEGLRLGQELGVDPWAFGLIASTDTHIAAPGAVAEDGFPGHGGAGASNRQELPPGLPDSVAFNPGGLVAVWAEENTREAIFSALRRKEVYGTSGPRITLRFFGGWGYEDGLCDAVDMVHRSYDGGVPMGGSLPAPPPGSDLAPRFVISALRDVSEEGAPLQRAQVVKVWVDPADGAVRSAVWDVAGDADSAAGVDTATCQPTGAAGSDALCAVLSDPAFDPLVPALWYARVVEDPRCRWTRRQCAAAGVDCGRPETVTEGFGGCCDARFAAAIQERAWSSPVFWLPGQG